MRLAKAMSKSSHSLECVLHAFVDESERDDRFYFLGALIVSDRQLTFLRSELDGLMRMHARAHPSLDGAELHGSTTMRASEQPWRSVPVRLRLKIFEQAIDCVARSRAHIYIEGVNIVRHAARRYPDPIPPRELAFSHLFERINGACDREQPAVRIIADEHHTADVSRSNFTRYRIAGTYGYRSSRLPNIDPNIDFIASHTDRALQAADLVTHLYNRIMTVSERDARAHNQKHAMWAALTNATSWPNGRVRIWP